MADNDQLNEIAVSVSRLGSDIRELQQKIDAAQSEIKYLNHYDDVIDQRDKQQQSDIDKALKLASEANNEAKANALVEYSGGRGIQIVDDNGKKVINSLWRFPNFNVVQITSTSVRVHGGTWYRRAGDSINAIDLTVDTATSGSYNDYKTLTSITVSCYVFAIRDDSAGTLTVKVTASDIPPVAADLTGAATMRDVRILAHITCVSNVITKVEQVRKGGNIHDVGTSYQMFEVAPWYTGTGTTWYLRVYDGTWLRAKTTTSRGAETACTIYGISAPYYEYTGTIGATLGLYIKLDPATNRLSVVASIAAGEMYRLIATVTQVSGIPIVTQLHTGYLYSYEQNLDSLLTAETTNDRSSLGTNADGNAEVYGFEAASQYQSPFRGGSLASMSMGWRMVADGTGEPGDVNTTPTPSDGTVLADQEGAAAPAGSDPITKFYNGLYYDSTTELYIADAIEIYAKESTRDIHVNNGAIVVKTASGLGDSTFWGHGYIDTRKFPKWQHTKLDWTNGSGPAADNRYNNNDHDLAYWILGTTYVHNYGDSIGRGTTGRGSEAGVMAIDLTNSLLKMDVSNGDTRLDWFNAYLYEVGTPGTTLPAIRADWDEGELYDDYAPGAGFPANALSLDWRSRQLVSATKIVGDWSTQKLYDSGGFDGSTVANLSVDWGGRLLYGSEEKKSLDWTSRFAYDSNERKTIDYNAGLLYDYVGGEVAMLDWRAGGTKPAGIEGALYNDWMCSGNFHVDPQNTTGGVYNHLTYTGKSLVDGATQVISGGIITTAPVLKSIGSISPSDKIWVMP